jgi:hypothetical protein
VKKITTVLGFIVLAFSMLMSPSASAACNPPTKEITIINGAGKATELCVPEQAIPHIGGGGVVVIPAVCPCFSQNELEVLDPPTCGNARSYTEGDHETEVRAAVLVQFSAGQYVAEWNSFDQEAFQDKFTLDPTGAPGKCRTGIGPANYCKHPMTGAVDVTLEEAQACAEILWATFDWYPENQNQ